MKLHSPISSVLPMRSKVPGAGLPSNVDGGMVSASTRLDMQFSPF